MCGFIEMDGLTYSVCCEGEFHVPGDIYFFTTPRLIFPSLSPPFVSIKVPRGVWGLSSMRELEKVVGGWSTAVPLLQVGTEVLLTLFSQLALVVCSRTISAYVCRGC